VLGGVKVLGRVLILGGIAATDVAAGQAETKMNPGVAHLEAFFAPRGPGFHAVDVF
jgi:hypothetical protein